MRISDWSSELCSAVLAEAGLVALDPFGSRLRQPRQYVGIDIEQGGKQGKRFDRLALCQHQIAHRAEEDGTGGIAERLRLLKLVENLGRGDAEALPGGQLGNHEMIVGDRKSTRLNSSP